jgi:dTDP-glucose 4,6-dehydratase
MRKRSLRVLITGAAGFIGHHIVEHVLRNTNWEVIALDRLDETSTLHRLTDIECWPTEKARIRFVFHDLRAELNPLVTGRLGAIDLILHLAASTHVDRSIVDPRSFVLDNVLGTCNLLEYARKRESQALLLYFSTDEVFGSAPLGTEYKEWDRYRAGNPYAASKAGAEELCIAYANTYGLPVIVTHTMNVIGERQHPEKFVPLVVRRVLHDETVTIHADRARTKPGSRFYIHARNVAAAVLYLIERVNREPALCGDKFNIVGDVEIDNLKLARRIAEILGHELSYDLVDFHSSRPGHDLRYALDGTKMRDLGFRYPKTFDESLEKTVLWFRDNPAWLI